MMGLVRVLGRLTPRQISDEVALALEEMKRKGVQAGIAAGFFAVALAFIAFLAVALIVAAIMGFATLMSPWLAALLVAGIFLVIALIGALIGLSRFKKAMPLVPESAIRGVKYDIGILKEGRSFNPATLDVKKEKPKPKPEEKKAAEHKEPAPSIGELQKRSELRRLHLADARDGLGRKLDVRTQASSLVRDAKSGAANAADSIKTRFPSSQRGGEEGGGDAVQTLKDRWVPLTVLAISLGTIAVLLRRLLQK
jgi:uncharacterized membrane protein YqjE